jgi:hypothetical protein
MANAFAQEICCRLILILCFAAACAACHHPRPSSDFILIFINEAHALFCG